MADRLPERLCRVTVSLPVTTPGDFNTTTTDELVINGGTGPNSMRVQFKIDKTDQKQPNTSQIIISNLSDTTRGRMQKKGVKVTLEAGYKATGMVRIFRGDVRTCDPVRNGSDWDSTLKLGDGERAYRYARVQESFGAGTPAGVIMQRLAGLSGLTLGNVPTQAAALRQTYDHGYVASGRWSDVFSAFVKSLRLTWSIQYGAIQVRAPGDSSPPTVPLLSPSSGLIGSPEFGTPEKKGKPALLKFTALLSFAANPGDQVQLQSDKYNGFVRLRKVSLEGDTHGQDWYANCESVLAT